MPRPDGRRRRHDCPAGYRKPPTFHQDRLRQAAPGYTFDVITNGFGAMPDYAQQIPVPDRWAIVAYIKALQRSQNAAVGSVPAEARAALESAESADEPTGQARDHMHDATYTRPPAWTRCASDRSSSVSSASSRPAAGALVSPGQFFSIRTAPGLPVLAGRGPGGLALTMLQHLSGGGWGVVLRRIFEAAARTLPWMAIFFLPLVFGLRDLYPWIRHGMVAQDHLLKEKAVYLNVPFFLARAAFCFIV